MLIDGRQMHIQITKAISGGTSFCPATRRGARRSRSISMTRSRSPTTASTRCGQALWTAFRLRYARPASAVRRLPSPWRSWSSAARTRSSVSARPAALWTRWAAISSLPPAHPAGGHEPRVPPIEFPAVADFSVCFRAERGGAGARLPVSHGRNPVQGQLLRRNSSRADANRGRADRQVEGMEGGRCAHQRDGRQPRS